MASPPSHADTPVDGRVVGVDIGGTKTHVLVASIDPSDGGGSVDIVVPSSSWRARLGDFAADGAALRRVLLDWLGDAVLRAPLAVGAHGCDTTAQCRQFELELRRHFTGPVLVVNDSELMAPATGLEKAIGVVVGTGSIATARSVTGELVTAGGWGWLLGDEGSAPGLVREAVRAVLSHLDRDGAPDPLGRRLMAAFAASDGAGLALAVSQSPSAEAWGAHALEVFRAADDGSEIAAEVIRVAGEQLALLVDLLLRRGIPADAVVAGGSVIERQPRLQEAFREALGRVRPDLPLRILGRAPVNGAVALARGIAQQTPTHVLEQES